MSCLWEAALDSMISSGTPYWPMETWVVYRIDMNVIDPEVYSTLRQAMQRNYPRHLFLPNADSLVFRSQPTDYSAQDKDDRPDTDVKKEIYEKYIKDKYNVVYAIDDRTRLVDQRRELGIFTFDVNQTREVF